MIRGLLGRKLGMTQMFDQDGNMLAVTLIEAGPCTVLALKDIPVKVVLGYESVNESRLNKPKLSYFKKIGVAPQRIIKEFRSSNNAEYQVGQEIKTDFFKPGDFVDISGVSVGKGFQGGMKRWGWSGGPGGHGSMHHRRVGSIGACADPSRTFRGRNMPGRMGCKSVTVQGLRVMDIDIENNMLVVKGAVPGHKNSIIEIKRSQKKAFKGLDEKAAVVVHKVNPMKQSKAKVGAKSKGKKK